MKSDLAIKIMEENKHFYDSIAEDFSATRSYIGPEFKTLVKYFKDNDRVLDLGCGNGRFFELFTKPNLKVKYFGADNSARLVELAKSKYPEGDFRVTDGLTLPFESNFFDNILAIAVLHHIPSKVLRQQFLKEAFRVLKKDGRLIVTTWSLRPIKSKLLFKYFALKLLGLSKLDWHDVYVPWQITKQRYIHHFSQKELKKLLQSIGFTVENISFYTLPSQHSSLVAVVKK